MCWSGCGVEVEESKEQKTKQCSATFIAYKNEESVVECWIVSLRHSFLPLSCAGSAFRFQ